MKKQYPATKLMEKRSADQTQGVPTTTFTNQLHAETNLLLERIAEALEKFCDKDDKSESDGGPR